MQEKDIENRLVRDVHTRGGMAWKFISPGIAGVPDRIVLMPKGHMAFVELKAPGKKPRPIQKLRIRQIERLGYKVYVIEDPGQIGGVLDEIQSS